MKKTRVYELAKEFRKDTRELLDLIHEMEIEVASHASSLSPEDTERVRVELRSAQTHEIEQKRISSGVIRRRKTAIQPPPEEPAPASPEEAVPVAVESVAEEATAPEEIPQPPEVEAEPAPEAVAEPEEAPAPQEIEEELPEVEAKPEKASAPTDPELPQVRKPRWAATTERARIISKPSGPVTPQAPPPEAGAPPSPDKEEAGRRRKGKVEAGKRRGRRRDVSRDELYSGRGGQFRPHKMKRTAKKSRKTQVTQPKAIKMRIKMAEAITVADLAKRMGIKAPEVVKQLMSLGVMVTLNQTVDLDTAAVVAGEFGYEVERDSFEEAALIAAGEDKPDDLEPRPPVVTIMGHVDHGKSSLLEKISLERLAIVDGEAGGITQHIGAYRVELVGGEIIFLDTPGHEAFTAMRARGAQVTDLIVLVVAADDGVMEQTREAINHAQAAGVPIIVAVNKMDKADIDPERVKRELSEIGLAPEDWGGETLFNYVSAKTGAGIDDLLEAIRLQAELLELKANSNKPAVGHIIEARLDKGRGAVATVLIEEGTLKVGDAFVVGAQYGKTRALLDDRGQPVDEAGPSLPVQVQGLAGVPEAGDEFLVLENERAARQISDHRAANKRETELSASTRVSLESLMEGVGEGEVKELNVIIKADVQGSIEALREVLEKQSTDKVKLMAIHTGAGAVTEHDVMLAAASQAIIIGFNVRANSKVSEIIEAERVEVRYYDVIYKVVEEIREAMAGLLDSLFEERLLGRADVRQVFKVPRAGSVAGSYVTEGLIRRGGKARLLRDGVVVYDGLVESLRRFKDDAKEVAEGYECGIGLENFNDIKEGDQIEVYELEEVRPELGD